MTPQEPRFQCEPCEKIFYTKTSLYNHLYKVHPEWKAGDRNLSKFELPGSDLMQSLLTPDTCLSEESGSIPK